LQPVIGITCGHMTRDVEDRYYVLTANIHAVAEAGGVPVLIPNAGDEDKLAAALDLVDGLYLPGGNDVDPHLYGEEPLRGMGEFDPDWDALDVTAAKMALERGLPILAICRGVQVLNVAAGGTLYQDIPSQIPGSLKHRQEGPRWAASHGIRLEPDSRLARLFGTTSLRVNSFHHQAVKNVAPGFRATAKAPDGVVEAIERVEGPFVVGVQWHPELMVSRDPTHRVLFSAFVEAAAARAAKNPKGSAHR